MKRIFSSRPWWERVGHLWDNLLAYLDGGWQSVRRSLKLLPGRLARAFRARRSTHRHRYVPAFESLETRVLPSISVSVNNFSSTENTLYSGVIATASGLASGVSYSANIAWGDGASSGVTASGMMGIWGSHTYVDEGQFNVSVTVSGGGDSATGTGSATIADAPLWVSGTGFSAIAGTSFSGQVATFSDAAGPEPGASFTASIQWGDGGTSPGTVGGTTVTGGHTYTAGGPYSVTVVVYDDGGATGSTTFTTTVGVPLSVSGVNFSATEGQQFNGTVATVSGLASGSNSATINWGDGGSNTVTFYGSSISGSHTYIEEGSYTVTVTVTGGGQTATSTCSETVIDPPVTATGSSVGAVENQPFTDQKVATFTDPGGPEDRANYGATITWGDGSTATTGTIAVSGSSFIVQGSHTYTEENASTYLVSNPYTITVTITHEATAPVTVTASAYVSDPAVIATGGFTLTAVEGQTSAVQTVATFTDPGGSEDEANYSATIVWGDYSGVVPPTYTATIVQSGSVYLVQGSHVYSQESASDHPGSNPYSISVTIYHESAPSVSVTSSATVSDPAVSATGDFTVTAVEAKQSQLQTVATFTDPGGAESTGNYSATIDWGDGSDTESGNITVSGSLFYVQGSHKYFEESDEDDPYSISVTITHESTAPVTVTSSAEVSDAPLYSLNNIGLFGAFVVTAVESQASVVQTVAEFVDTGIDPSNPEPVADYTASIDWGDGEESSGAIVPQGVTQQGAYFFVQGSHTYAEESAEDHPGSNPYSISVTIYHDDAPPIVATASATVSDAPVVATGGFTLSAVEGQTSAVQTVAAFTEPGGLEASSEYSASIMWSYSDVELATLVASGSEYLVQGSHKYTEEGTYPIAVYISHENAPWVSVTSTVTVSDQSVSATGGFPVTAVEGQASTVQTVATFTDPAGPESTSNYAATIIWGDGKTSTGTITGSGSPFYVTGSHTYDEESAADHTGSNPYSISVTITHESAPPVTVTSSATVSDPALLAILNTFGGVTAIEGQESEVQTVAVFRDPAGPDPAAEYTATIAWGDGEESPGTIVPTSAGLFSGTQYLVQGSHTYAEESASDHDGSNPYSISVTIYHDDTPPIVTTSYATVSDPSVIAAGGFTVTAMAGEESDEQTVATFTDPGESPDEEPSPDEYSATIAWGDGQTSSGTIVPSGSHFLVQGSHTYADESEADDPATDPYTITVTISHETAAPVSVTSSATVSLGATGGFTVSAVEGALSTVQTVATFRDADSAGDIDDFSATIEWGDGETSDGTIVAYGSQFLVQGSHTYHEDTKDPDAPDPYTITVTIVDETAPPVSVESSAIVDDALLTETHNPPPNHPPLFLPTLSAAPHGVTASQNTPLGNVLLATVTTTDTHATAGSFTAEIEWGDDSPNGTVHFSDDFASHVFDLLGDHTYVHAGKMTARIIVHEGWAQTQPFAVLIDVLPVPVPPPAYPLHGVEVRQWATEDVALPDNTVLAGIIDDNPAHPCHFATVDWGDGTSDSFEVFGGSVQAGHTYASAGAFLVTVTVGDDVGHSVTLYETAYVADPLPTLGAHGVVANPGEAFSQALLGTVINGDEIEGFAELSVLVNWGDSNAFESVNMLAEPGGPAWLEGGHTYADSGAYTLTLLARDAEGAFAIATASVSVSDGAQNNVPLGTFNDANPFSDASDFTATTVAWDGGDPEIATVVANGGGQTAPTKYKVTGAAPDIGTLTAEVIVTDDGGSTLTINKTVTVGAPALVAGANAAFLPDVGMPYTDTVATFTDPTLPEGLSAFTAEVDWGDGDRSECEVVDDGNNVFTVKGDGHIFTHVQGYDVTVLIEETSAGGRTFLMTTAADVQDDYESPQLVMQPASGQIVGYADRPIVDVVLATLSDVGFALDEDPDTTVTIDWGDGSTLDTGCIVDDGGKNFSVHGAHLYTDGGTYDIVVTLQDGTDNDTDGDPNPNPVTLSARIEILPVMSAVSFSSFARDSNDPEQVTLTSIGEAGAELNTGGLRLVHPLDFDLSPGTGVGGNPALAYNSATAAPHAVIKVVMASSATGVLPSTVALQVTWDGTLQSPLFFSTAGFAPGDTMVFAIEETASTTSQHHWEVKARVSYAVDPMLLPNQPPVPLVVDMGSIGGGTVEIVSEVQSPIGPGWGIAGIDHLAFVCGGILWVTGSGDNRLFTDLQSPNTRGDGPYLSPPEDFGTLLQHDDFTFTYTAKDKTQWNFDALGHLLSVIDTHGIARSYTYDTFGRLSLVIAPDGGVTALTYASDTGPLTSIAEPGGRVLYLAHAGDGTLTGISDVDGTTRAFTYAGFLLTRDQWQPYDTAFAYAANLLSAIGQGTGSVWLVHSAEANGLGAPVPVSLETVASITDALNDKTLYGIDLRGRQVAMQNPGGGVQTWARNTAGLVTQYTDASLNSTFYIWNNSGDLIEVYDTDGNVTDYVYETTFHHVTREISYPAGGRLDVTAYTYDGNNGDLLTSTAHFGTAAAATTVNLWSAGLLTRSTDADGNETDYGYDFARRLTQVDLYDWTGYHLQHTGYDYDFVGNVYHIYTFDNTTVDTFSPANRLLEEDVRRANGTLAQSNEYAYLPAGQLWQTIDADWNVTTSYFDLAGRETRRETHDGYGDLVTRDDWTYDAAGNTASHTDGNRNVELMADNPDGEPTHSELHDAQGALVSQDTRTWNAQDNVTSDTDGDGNETFYTWDAHGWLTLRVTLDYFGDLVSAESWHYDNLGNLTYEIDALGNRTDYSHDAHRHVTYKAVHDSQNALLSEEFWTYDSVTGDVTSCTDPDGNTTAWQYDGAGRVTRERLYDSDENLLREETWTFDPLGNPLTHTDPRGVRTTQSYDGQNNVLTRVVTQVVNNVTVTVSSETWTYDAKGRVLTYLDPRQILTLTGYDALGRVTALAVSKAGVLVRSESWSFDANGNPLTNLDPDNVLTTQTFDGDNRVRTKVVTRVVNNITILVSNEGWTYDGNGNVLTYLDPRNVLTTQTYNAADRVLTRIVSQVVNYVTVVWSSEQWTYDANGNTLSYRDPDYVLTTWTYGANDNVLTQVVTKNGQLVSSESWIEDAEGDPLGEIDPNGVRTLKTYDGAGRVTSVVVSRNNVTIRSESWTFDRNGNALTYLDPDGVLTTQTYDGEGNVLTKVVSKGNVLVSSEIWTYDPDGNVLTYRDPNGVLTTQTYDWACNVLTKVVTKNLGLVSSESWSYDAEGNVLTYLDPNGVLTTQAYDGANRVVLRELKVGNAVVRSEAWTFDGKGNTLTYRDPDNVLTTQSYDGENNVLTRVVTKGNVTVSTETWTYDAEGNVLTYLDRNGVLTTQSYDWEGNVLTKVVSKNGVVVTSEEWTFDANGNTLTYLDPRGVKTTQSYDGANRVLTKVVTKNSQLVSSESWTFDANGNQLTYSDPDYVLTTKTFDGANRVLTRVVSWIGVTISSETWTYDANGNALTYLDPAGLLTTKTFDGANRVLSQVFSKNNVTLKSESWTYDPNGNTLTYTDFDNNTTAYGYDSENNRISERKRNSAATLLFQRFWEFDAGGREIGYTDGDGNQFEYEYDAQGNKTDQVVHDKYGALLEHESWLYDGNGNEISHTWNDGKVTLSTYDGANRLILQVTYSSQGGPLYQESWTYDAKGNTLSHIDPLGRETRWTYSALGFKLTETLAYGTSQAATTTWTYDADGNVLTITDPLGNVTAFGYDWEGNKTSTTDPLQHSATADFDGDGRMFTSTDRNGRRRDYTYDAMGRLLTDKWYDADGNLTETNTFTYDADGRMLTATNSNGTYTYNYDGLGRLIGVDEPSGLSLTFAYDTNGNRVLVQDSLGGTVQSTYDWANHLIREVYTQSGQPTLRIDQRYDWAGRIEEQICSSDAAGTDIVAITDWTYDAKGEVIEEKHKNAAGGTIADYQYTYDAAGEITQQTDHGVTIDFAYDALGQLTSDGTENNAYDPNGNRTNTGYQTGPGNQLLSNGTWNYNYDAEGNETKKVNIATGLTWQYGYDNRNEITRASEWNEDATAHPGTAYVMLEEDFKYGPLGERLEDDLTTYVNGAGTTVVKRFGYDAWNPAKPAPVGNENWDVWVDLNAQNAFETRYFRGDKVDELFCRFGADGHVYWSLADRQSSIRDIVDNTGAVKDSIRYDAFGNILSQTDSSKLGRYAWTGRELDVEIDLQYNHARYFDPATGRWISQDPLGFDAGDSNLYRYVTNRPTASDDPSGMVDPPFGGGFGGHGGGGSASVPIPNSMQKRLLQTANSNVVVASQPWALTSPVPTLGKEKGSKKDLSLGDYFVMGMQSELAQLQLKGHVVVEGIALIREINQKLLEKEPNFRTKMEGTLFDGLLALPQGAAAIQEAGAKWIRESVLEKNDKAGKQAAVFAASALTEFSVWDLIIMKEDAESWIQDQLARSAGDGNLPQSQQQQLMLRFRPGDEIRFRALREAMRAELRMNDAFYADRGGKAGPLIELVGTELLTMGSSKVEGLVARGVIRRTSPEVVAATRHLAQRESQVVERLASTELSSTARGLLQAQREELAELLRVLTSSCFVAGTPLLTPYGDKPIEAFCIGDEILSRSEHDPDGPVAIQRVERVFIRTTSVWMVRIHGHEIRTTAGHPFYLRGKGWTEAGAIKPGDKVLSHDGQWVTVEAVTDLNEVATVYNLRVSDYHTYFVGSREWGFSVWAHNANYEVVHHGGGWYRIRNTTTGEFVNGSIDSAGRFVPGGSGPLTLRGASGTQPTLGGLAAEWNATSIRNPVTGAHPDGIVWGQIHNQGAPWERHLETLLPGTRLPNNFEAFDFFNRTSGLATSAKTLQTNTAARMANPGQVYDTLVRYIDEAVNFTHDTVQGVTVTRSMITAREMQLAIPAATTPAQWQQIERAIQYGRSQVRPITIRVTIIE